MPANERISPRLKDACPYDAATRAARCESCCATNNSMTPCVVAWLRLQTDTPSNVIPLHAPRQRAA
jgi:hypothetical protein